MTNIMDHYDISKRVEKIFELSEKYLKEAKGLDKKDLEFKDIDIPEAGVHICDGNMIHLDGFTILKNNESRETTIFSIPDDTNEEPKKVVSYNTCDDPGQRVRVGKTEREQYQILSILDKSAVKLQKQLDLVFEVKKDIKAKRSSRPGSSRPGSR